MKTTTLPSLLTPTPMTWPGLASCAGCARRWAQKALGADHPLIDEALMALSEMVGNAVEHTRSGKPGGRFTVSIAADERMVRIEVTDEGADTAPAVRDCSGERGRGLMLVDAIASDWGSRTVGDCRAVWAEITTAIGQEA